MLTSQHQNGSTATTAKEKKSFTTTDYNKNFEQAKKTERKKVTTNTGQTKRLI